MVDVERKTELDSERMGYLLKSLVLGSAGGFVLIRHGRHRTERRIEWRVSVRVKDAHSKVRDRTHTGITLIDALERAAMRFQRKEDGTINLRSVRNTRT